MATGTPSDGQPTVGTPPAPDGAYPPTADRRTEQLPPRSWTGRATSRRGRLSTAGWAALVIGVAVVTVIAGLVVTGTVRLPQLGSAKGAGIPPTNFTTVPYTSSVDGFPLSFSEWLPPNYSPSNHYPLIVYLHGQQDTSGRWFSGGLTNDLVQYILNATDLNNLAATESLINETRGYGAILIALNTRSGSGWYINSPCGGPQEQDVLDAIAFEKSRRSVSQVFLMGESMGTEGTLYVASQNPSLFSGIAVIAPVTDLYEDVAYRMTLANDPQDPWAEVSIQAKAALFCGVLPGTGNSSQLSVARMFENMSPLRFNPTAFAGIPIYVTSGGMDDRAPNNVSIWSQWMNMNNTLVNATCNYAPQLGEPVPPSCASQTFESFHRQDPSRYTFRYIFEPDAGHSVAQVDPADLLGFWFGSLPGGYYLGAPQSTVITPSPGLTY